MKYALLLPSIFSIGVSAQNITDNNVSFDYVQLPTNPIDPQYTTYKIVVNKFFETSNQDSLNLHQARIDAIQVNYDAQMSGWVTQKRAIDRQYLTTLAAWEKNNLAAGVSTIKPDRPQYPLMPFKEELAEPRLHDDITEQYVGSIVKLEGFTAGEGGAEITIDIQPMTELAIVKKVNGSGTATKYEYRCNYKLQVLIKVQCPARGIVFNTMIGSAVKSHAINTFATTYDYEIWMLDNREKMWMELQAKARAEAMAEVNSVINENCGFPLKRRNTEVYSVKSHEKFTYTELTTAFTTAEQGYRLIAQKRDHTAAASKLLEAISIWETVLKESNMNDNKSRVNDKITGMLHYNIAEAYAWLSQFEESEKYINLTIADGVLKFKGMANDLDAYLNQQIVRWNANY